MTESNPQPATRVAVLAPAAVSEPFDYLAPAGTCEGALVEASLQGRNGPAVVWQIPLEGSRIGEGAASTPSKSYTLKPINAVLDLPPLAKSYRQWLDWIAQFTLAPRGAVLSLCGLRYALKPPKRPFRPPEYALNLPVLTPEQHAATQAIIAGGDARPILLDGVTGSGKTEVYFHAIAAALESRVQSSEFSELEESTRSATREPLAAGGSNMTQCHVERASPPAQILVLLPEIALTHQWLSRFERAFGVTPLVWHSRTTPAARAKVWHAALRGEPMVVGGARSALFLPFANLKLIIVDEEHDPSYKQEDGVLYHARDMAIARAHFDAAQVVLVSATPALETLENVRIGKYRALHLAQRFGAAGMAKVALVDLRNEPPERGDFLSPAVKQAMLHTLARGEQVLFFLNRRGYAPLLLCRGCGHRFECKNCSAWLVVHGKIFDEGGLTPPSLLSAATPAASGSASPTHYSSKYRASLHCHHCAHKEPMPKECPECKAPADKLASCGPGVERIAEEVRAIFAAPKIMQNDATGTPSPLAGEGWDGGANRSAQNSHPLTQPSPARGEGFTAAQETTSHYSPPTTHHSPSLLTLSSDEAIAADTWQAIEHGEVDILVGTQMVAKGHHFPKLTLVVVVDADVGLSGADLRAGERTYQLLHQLGGRAGRGDAPGHVLIQTYAPEHPVMQALLAQDRDQLMALEAAERRAGGWPPYGQLAAILLDGVDESKVRAAGQMLARSAPQDKRITVLGPAPAPLSKLRGQYRYRLLIKADKTIGLQATLKAWLAGQKFSGVRIKLDVNPYYFL